MGSNRSGISCHATNCSEPRPSCRDNLGHNSPVEALNRCSDRNLTAAQSLHQCSRRLHAQGLRNIRQRNLRSSGMAWLIHQKFSEQSNATKYSHQLFHVKAERLNSVLPTSRCLALKIVLFQLASAAKEPKLTPVADPLRGRWVCEGEVQSFEGMARCRRRPRQPSNLKKLDGYTRMRCETVLVQDDVQRDESPRRDGGLAIETSHTDERLEKRVHCLQENIQLIFLSRSSAQQEIHGVPHGTRLPRKAVAQKDEDLISPFVLQVLVRLGGHGVNVRW
mmetsp:Transcript_107714/g.343809  ORF Transcript_107714/g.343809 Transcript_107714/m.343809 type:complete len:278 (-) Transcript_107714:492-1325(-)